MYANFRKRINPFTLLAPMIQFPFPSLRSFSAKKHTFFETSSAKKQFMK